MFPLNHHNEYIDEVKECRMMAWHECCEREWNGKKGEGEKKWWLVC